MFCNPASASSVLVSQASTLCFFRPVRDASRLRRAIPVVQMRTSQSSSYSAHYSASTVCSNLKIVRAASPYDTQQCSVPAELPNSSKHPEVITNECDSVALLPHPAGFSVLDGQGGLWYGLFPVSPVKSWARPSLLEREPSVCCLPKICPSESVVIQLMCFL